MSAFLWQLPYDIQSILDEEVEDNRDETDEGYDDNAGYFLVICRIKLRLGDFSESSLKFYFDEIVIQSILLYVIPQFTKATSKLSHVLCDGVKVHQSARQVTLALRGVQGIHDNLSVARKTCYMTFSEHSA